KIHYVDDRTGVIDMRMDPQNPENLLVAFWERQRDEFDSHPGTEMPPAEGYDRYDPIKKWGSGSGIYRTTDGGKTFHKVTKGLPPSHLGRIGPEIYRKDPKIVFAVIDCEKIGMGTPPATVYLGVQGENAPGGAKLVQVSPDSPAARAGLEAGDVVKAVDKKDLKDYDTLVQQIQSHKAGDKLAFTVVRGTKTFDVQATLANRPEAGPAGGGRRGGGGGGGGRGQRGPLGGAIGIRGEDSPDGVRVLEV